MRTRPGGGVNTTDPATSDDPHAIGFHISALYSPVGWLSWQRIARAHEAARGSDEAMRLRVEVRDDGPGIDPRHHRRVFERFYRVDPGRARDMGGTGLGLAIVKHLVEAMGGQVGVDARRPHGSIFWFTVPTAAGALGGPDEDEPDEDEDELDEGRGSDTG